MTAAIFKDFRPRKPRISEELLTVNISQIADNCDLRSGEMRPFKDTTVENTPTKVGTKKTIYPFASTPFWFHWLNEVHVIKGPIAGDTSELTYYTGDGAPKMTDNTIATSGGGSNYPIGEFLLGVPAPTTAPTIGVTEINAHNGAVTTISYTSRRNSGTEYVGPVIIGSVGHGLYDGAVVVIENMTGFTDLNGGQYTATVITDNLFSLDETQGVNYGAVAAYTGSGTWERVYDEAEKESRTYVYTYVSTRGEEGPPSPASEVIDVADGYEINLSAFETGPAGNYDLDTKNIYRSNTGNLGTELELVASISLATTTYNDSVAREDLGAVLESSGWEPPPSDLKGLIILPNGVAVGHTDTELCFSVPYKPHAWPIAYRHACEDTIVGLGSYGTTVVVLTVGKPRLASGYDPGSTTLDKMEFNQSCRSSRSITSTDYGVAYAAPDGLAIINSSGGRLLTPYLTKDDWDVYKPDSILGCYHDGRYFGFYDTGVVQKGFIIDLTDPDRGGLVDIDTYATACYANPEDDELYLQVGNDIVKWHSHASNKLTAIIKSGEARINKPVNFGFCQVKATAYPVTFDLFADGVQKVTSKTISNNKPFRLPGAYLAENWHIQISGTNNVKAVFLGEAITDIQQVS